MVGGEEEPSTFHVTKKYTLPPARWDVAKPDPVRFKSIVSLLGCTALTAQCLINRGVDSPSAAALFFNPRLKDLGDPFLLPDIFPAIDRLMLARNRREPIVIFGDYDADGITSTAMLKTFLDAFGWRCEIYLPHRFDDGYGLSPDGVANCLQQHPVKLLIAVDCGSTSVEVIRDLSAQGIDTIVIDHHQLGIEKPAALALINPKNSSLSLGHLEAMCSAGLVFKVCHALQKQLRTGDCPEAHTFELRDLLDLAAIGTIADLVPMEGENRTLVRAGLLRLATSSRPGIIALKNTCKLDGAVDSTDVGFRLAPRLNAAGRLENASHALDLLLTQDPNHAATLARDLDEQNTQRQTLEKQIASDALRQIAAKFEPERDWLLLASDASWHLGVVGIVASRVVRQYHRPAIILGGDGSGYRGSGRSIHGIDLAALLRGHDALLIKHGGHAMAAGLSIETENLAILERDLNQWLKENTTPELFQSVIKLDAQVRFSSLTLASVTELQNLAPHGQGNPTVKLVTPGLRLVGPARLFGKTSQHLRLQLTDGTATLEAICWNGADLLPVGCTTFDAVFTPKIDTYREPKVLLELTDLRPLT